MATRKLPRHRTNVNLDVAGIYVRISDDRESEEAGITRQDEDCHELAAAEKLRVHAVYSDNDTGASTRSTKPRPGYDRILADAKAGTINVIIAYTSGRLTRRPMELNEQIQLAERYGVRFRYVKSPSYDLNTADGRLVARMMADIDAAESERIAERVSRAAQQRAEKGLYLGGGNRPYGFDLVPHPVGNHQNTEFVVNEDEAKIIRDVADRVLTHEPLRRIAIKLNEQNVPTVTGAQWCAKTLRDMLLKKLVMGVREFGGMEVGRLAGEPILDPAVWADVHEVLTRQSRSRKAKCRPARWLLTGIAQCLCGAPVDGGAREAYRCRSLRNGPGGGGHIKRSAPRLDDLIAGMIIARLAMPDAAEVFTRPSAPDVDLPALRREAGRLADRKIALAERHGAGECECDDLEYSALQRGTKTRLREIEEQLSSAEDTSPVANLPVGHGVDAVRTAWEALDLDQQREVVRAMVMVRIMPEAWADFEDNIEVYGCHDFKRWETALHVDFSP